MNYKIDDNIIHDEKAMWALACEFQISYSHIKEEIKEIERDNYIFINGKIIHSGDRNYKKILNNYKKELEFMNEIINFALKNNSDTLGKYIKTE